MIFLLPAITVRLFRSVLRADDAPFGPVMGTRGEVGAAAGMGATGVLSQFLFEAFCGIILVSEQPCIMRESDDDDRFQRGSFPPGGHSDGGPLVCGVSAEHA